MAHQLEADLNFNQLYAYETTHSQGICCLGCGPVLGQGLVSEPEISAQ